MHWSREPPYGSLHERYTSEVMFAFDQFVDEFSQPCALLARVVGFLRLDSEEMRPAETGKVIWKFGEIAGLPEQFHTFVSDGLQFVDENRTVSIHPSDLFLQHAAAKFELSPELLARLFKRRLVMLLETPYPRGVQTFEIWPAREPSECGDCRTSFAVYHLPIRARLT